MRRRHACARNGNIQTKAKTGVVSVDGCIFRDFASQMRCTFKTSPRKLAGQRMDCVRLSHVKVRERTVRLAGALECRVACCCVWSCDPFPLRRPPPNGNHDPLSAVVVVGALMLYHLVGASKQLVATTPNPIATAFQSVVAGVLPFPSEDNEPNPSSSLAQ